MASITSDIHIPAGAEYLTHDKGIRSWLLTQDHKRISIMYLALITVALFLGGVFALAVRIALWTPEADLVSNDTYNKMFTLHGAVMIFLVIIPGIPAALGNFVLPLQLGLKDVAFPRVNLLSFWLYAIGTVFFLTVLAAGGIDTGWTLYPPYSLEGARGTAILLALTGAFIVGFSSILTAVNFMATIHKMRHPGMGWFRMPLFLWALYATGIIQIFATPVIGITVALGFLEKAFHLGIFMPEYGGDPVLFQHFFWFYSHPVVYVMVLPALGVISEIVSVFSRRTIFGYKFIAMSSIAIALIGFLVWGHHMFTSGQTKWVSLVFSAITFTVAIPSAIKVFNWLATMFQGSIVLKTPMLYGLAFFLLFGIGGLTGLFLASLATDINLHDTYFVVAHFHFVMVGSVITAFLGGLHYWWPKITGRMYSETLGAIASTMVFLGFNLTFIPQFLMGVQGAPRRYATYDEPLQGLNQTSTVGAFLLGLGMTLTLGYLLWSLKRGRQAPANPWGAATLEWATTSPPHPHNFETTPPIGDPYDYDLVQKISDEKGYVRTDGYNP